MVGRVFSIPVLTPFPDIPVHLVQAVAIGRLFTHGMGFSAGVSTIPTVYARVYPVKLVVIYIYTGRFCSYLCKVVECASRGSFICFETEV